MPAVKIGSNVRRSWDMDGANPKRMDGENAEQFSDVNLREWQHRGQKKRSAAGALLLTTIG